MLVASPALACIIALVRKRFPQNLIWLGTDAVGAAAIFLWTMFIRERKFTPHHQFLPKGGTR